MRFGMRRITTVLIGLFMIVTPPAVVLLSGENPIYMPQFLSVTVFGAIIALYGLRLHEDNE
jgi:hypothetical protein